MSPPAAGRNVVLIGLMGAGKTTVGRLVATRLGRPFVDTDALVEADAGRTVAEIFAAAGERGFRTLEAAAVRRVSAVGGQVVAVGGGAVLDPDTVTALRATGELILLEAPPATLAARVGAGDGRPLLAGAATPVLERLQSLRVERDAAYRAAAVTVVDTAGRTPTEVADDVVAWARTRPGVLTPAELVA